MAGAVHWIDGQAHQPGVVEKICPSIHITQNQWTEDWNLAYYGPHYSYISDYECVFTHPVNADIIKRDYGPQSWQDLQEAKQQGTNVPLTDLAHFTTPERAQDIINDKGFLGRMKKINENEDGDDLEARLSWWSPKFTEEVGNHVRNTLGTAIKPFVGDFDDENVLQNQFALSDAFITNLQRYGSSYFQYSISELCQYYKNYRGGGEIQFKILGTYLYKQEIMHAVLVCSDANEQFKDYPDIPTPDNGNNEAVVTRSEDGNWVWSPQATATQIARLQAHWQSFPSYRRWEHVAFAFHTPDRVFDPPDLEVHR